MVLCGDITIYDKDEKLQFRGVRICDRTSLEMKKRGAVKSGSIVIRIFEEDVPVSEGARLVTGVCEDDVCPPHAFIVTAVSKNKGICRTHYKVIAER